MKYNSLILFILLLAAQAAFAQPEPLVKPRYKVSITDSAYRQTKGFLFKISDTSVQMSYWPIRFAHEAARENLKEFSYGQINEIELKRTKSVGRGALIGAVAGALIGVVAGYIQGASNASDGWETFNATYEAAIYGEVGAVVGAGVGILIGALAKKKFTIGRNKQRFDEMKANVLYKTYGPK